MNTICPICKKNEGPLNGEDVEKAIDQILICLEKAKASEISDGLIDALSDLFKIRKILEKQND